MHSTLIDVVYKYLENVLFHDWISYLCLFRREFMHIISQLFAFSPSSVHLLYLLGRALDEHDMKSVPNTIPSSIFKCFQLIFCNLNESNHLLQPTFCVFFIHKTTGDRLCSSQSSMISSIVSDGVEQWTVLSDQHW